MVRHGNQTLGGEHAIVYADIELQCCTPKISMMLLTNSTSIIKKKDVKEKIAVE